MKELEKLAGEARRDVDAAQPGVTYRAEPEFEQSRETLSDLERALGMKELRAAFETSQRAAPAVERLARYLEEDVALSEHNSAYTRRDPQQVREAQRHARDAVPKVREIRDQLAKLFPDPRQVLGQKDQKRARRSSRSGRASSSGRRASSSRSSPSSPSRPRSSRPTRRRSSASRAATWARRRPSSGSRNPQRGHGEQELALDALSRFQKGLEEAAKKGQGKGDGPGFPYPFAEARRRAGGRRPRSVAREGEDPGRRGPQGAGGVPQGPARGDEAGAPERYRGEVQRYYEELVK